VHCDDSEQAYLKFAMGIRMRISIVFPSRKGPE